MKRVWIAVLFLSIVVGTGIFWCGDISETVLRLDTQVQETLRMMEASPSEAQQQLDAIGDTWDQAEQKLDYIVMHRHLDEARTALTKCRQYYTRQEYQMAQTELYLFSDILEEIAEKEHPAIENIF